MISVELVDNTNLSRKDIYGQFLTQLDALIAQERNLIANLSNLAAAIKEQFNFHWVGFYLADENDLVLGPFQGPLACTRIAFNKGVCGHVYSTQKSKIVSDVSSFDAHIACSPETKSEIVVPVIVGGEVKLLIDIDSVNLAEFDEHDLLFCEKLAQLIAAKHE